MDIPGRVHNGVVERRIEVPLVRTEQPGSVSLTGALIAAILDKEDRIRPDDTSSKEPHTL